jgi:hypothetical protein
MNEQWDISVERAGVVFKRQQEHFRKNMSKTMRTLRLITEDERLLLPFYITAYLKYNKMFLSPALHPRLPVVFG